MNKENNKTKKENLKEKEFEDKYKRALADYQNLLKRTEKEKQEFFKYANENLIYEILSVYDNLRLALEHSEKSGENNITEGIGYVIKQFEEVLKNAGVQKIKTAGKEFNPELMEAIEGPPAGGGEKVAKEVKPGYKLHDKVIMPAKVILE